jgi:glycosyltransferase involved in cell wall biosynthesis
VRLLAEEGYEVDVVTDAAEARSDVATITSREDGATVHRVSHDYESLRSAFHTFRVVRRIDAQRNYDLFHSFFLSYANLCTEIAKGRPVITSIRGGDENGLTLSPFFLSQFTKALRKASWVTSVNHTYLENMGRHVNLGNKSSVIRNGVARTSATWGLGETNRGVIGTVGQFRQEKDIPLLIRSYREVTPSFRRKLLLVGDFADVRERDWSATLTNEFELEREIEITGHLSHAEAVKHYRSMHAYVHCSSREGMPNSLLEAAAAGVPLIATASEGVREILTDGQDAMVVPHGYPQLLGAAVERVLRDDALATRLSEAAQVLAGRYSLARERAEWLELYDRLLSGRVVSAAV